MMLPKKLKATALGTLLGIVGMGPTLASAEGVLEEIQKRGTMRVGMSTFVPWAMRSTSGDLIGFEIDVAGAASIAAIYDDPLLVFVDAPSREAQRARLEMRGDARDRIEARLARAERELAAARDLGAVIVINDDFETCAKELRTLIDDYRDRRASAVGGPGD